MNTARNASVKAEPLIVATSLVRRFNKAVNSSTRKTRISPKGISTPPTWKLSGTLNSRGERSLKRSTIIARALKTKLQTTPKA